MSRTRIVRGKIFEKVQDHLTYFSDKSILESSANFYSENSETTIQLKDNPKKFKPIISLNKTRMLILQGSRRKGRNRDNTAKAKDLLFKDYTENKIGFEKLRLELESETYDVEKQNSWYSVTSRKENAAKIAKDKVEKIKEFCKKSDQDLFEIFSNDIEYYSIGAIEDIAKMMVAKMQKNEGGEFTNISLTEAVINHSSSKNFIGAIKNNIQKYLIEHKGNVKSLEIKDDSKGVLYDMLVEDNISSPKFGDKFSGLGITINDVWAYQVYITEYTVKGNFYNIKLEYIYWDHFGLDYPDIQKYNKDIFFAWFVLQHFKGYQPFITKIDIIGSLRGSF